MIIYAAGVKQRERKVEDFFLREAGVPGPDDGRLMGRRRPPVFISCATDGCLVCGPAQRLSEALSSYWSSTNNSVELGGRDSIQQHKKELVSRRPLEHLFIAGIQC